MVLDEAKKTLIAGTVKETYNLYFLLNRLSPLKNIRVACILDRNTNKTVYINRALEINGEMKGQYLAIGIKRLTGSLITYNWWCISERTTDRRGTRKFITVERTQRTDYFCRIGV